MSENYVDAIIIGAGISGISAAYHLKSMCPDKSFTILEGRDNIGGTWDLFKYPGIRSDSDMYTLGFAFRPWIDKKAIADGPSIMRYLNGAVDDYGLKEKIQFGKNVAAASWSSDDSLWRLHVNDKNGSAQKYQCRFMFVCTGYYNYENGYTPDFQGKGRFKGEFIHPQFWPEDLDYTDKKMVVIGSGATAITLIPELAAKGKHVTMLQRSPTYISAGPSEDKLANWMNDTLPQKLAYRFTRWKKIRVGQFFYKLARKYPKFMKGLILKAVQKEMGDDYKAEHFTPRYNPWDQRICLAPDSDFFESVKSDKADIVTDTIESITETGIQLNSGDHLDADIIISATGLELKFLGGIEMTVDGEIINLADTVAYKGMMFSDIPNLTLAFGYTNASWTLKCDLSNGYFCRLIDYMDKHNYTMCVPKQHDAELNLESFVDFSSSYILRYIDTYPKQGDKEPWKLKQDYYLDLKKLKKESVDDGIMEFSNPLKKTSVKKIEQVNEVD